MESGELMPILARPNSGNNIEMVTNVKEDQNPEGPAGKDKIDATNDDSNSASNNDQHWNGTWTKQSSNWIPDLSFRKEK